MTASEFEATAIDSGLPTVRSLIDPTRTPRPPQPVDGYLDLLGDAPPPAVTFAQRLMRTRFYSAIYQLGRPIGRRLAGGWRAPGRDQDRRQIAELLRLGPGAVVFDIACGPGNFTGWFGEQIGVGGLAIGLDASQQMLKHAVTDNSGDTVAYLRGDAEALPFRDETADAVSCLAALYLMNDPRQAIAEMTRTLKPGGRLVILTSLAPPVRFAGPVLGKLTGAKFFSRTEVTDQLADLGFVEIDQFTDGFAQTVAATKSVDDDGGNPHGHRA